MGKSQPFAPSFSASPRRNLYSSSFSRVDQEADQRRCSAPRMFSSSHARTSFLNSTTLGGSADTLKSIKLSFQASEKLPLRRCARPTRSNVQPEYASTRRSSRALHMGFLTGLPDIVWILCLPLVVIISRRWREVPLQPRCRNPIAPIFPPCFRLTTAPGGKTAAACPKD